jgi:hypothetical protein
MDVNVNLGSLTHAIASDEIEQLASQIAAQLRVQVVRLFEQFAQTDPTPAQTLDLENTLQDYLRESGRKLIQWLVSQLEPELEQMPGVIKHRGKSHRRLAEKSLRADVVTRFGKITLLRARYRRGRSGRTIFPLEMLLGIENGFTPAAADRVGKQCASTGSSQGRTLEMIVDQMATKIGTEKLRKLVGTLADGMEPFREQAQVEKLMDLIKKARQKKQNPVLSVSRDGVALGLAPWSSFEMASVACVSVLADGKKLGTVYLGCTPETNQVTLSVQLTSLLRATVRRCGDCVPEIVYVSDAGKVETAYWKNTLRKFFVGGVRIKITRVVDYYHAAERLTTIAKALKLGKDKGKRQSWLRHARWLLKQPGGHGRMLRSIAKMRELYGYKASEEEEAVKAERYLRRYRRFMNYAEMKSWGYPIGSGVVESACKQVVSERMKLSGMRWHKKGGQTTMTLRCLLLSGIWNTVYKIWLTAKPTVSDLIYLGTP